MPKQHKYWSELEHTKEFWYVHRMERYLTLKKQNTEICHMLHLGGIIGDATLSVKSESQKDKNDVIPTKGR